MLDVVQCHMSCHVGMSIEWSTMSITPYDSDLLLNPHTHLDVSNPAGRPQSCCFFSTTFVFAVAWMSLMS